MPTDDVMSEAVTLPVHGENGARSVQLPDGWIETAEVRARRVGRQIVLEPVTPEPHAPTPDGEGEIAWRYVNGQRVHPSWPPDYIEWLDEAQRSGLFANDDVERMDIELRDPDDMP